MNDDAPRLRAELAAALRPEMERSGGEAGPHPSAEELAAYRGGALAAGDAERVQAHLVGCRECLDRLLDLDDLAAAPHRRAAGVTRLDTAAAWRALAPRLAQTPGRTSGWAPGWRPRLWAVAAALLVATLALGVWGLRQRSALGDLRREVDRLSQPQPDVPIVDLFPPSSPRGAGPRPVPPELGAEAGYLTVVLHLPPSSEAAALEAVIADAGGRELWSGRLRGSEHGTLTLGIPRRYLEAPGARGAAGELRIHLYALQGSRRRLLETYALPLASDGDSF